MYKYHFEVTFTAIIALFLWFIILGLVNTGVLNTYLASGMLLIILFIHIVAIFRLFRNLHKGWSFQNKLLNLLKVIILCIISIITIIMFVILILIYLKGETGCQFCP